MIASPVLLPIIWIKAALSFEAAGCWLEAFSSWMAAGCPDKAVRALKKEDDVFAAATLLQESGYFAEALALWEELLVTAEESDLETRVASRFGLSACLFLKGEDEHRARIFYREAMSLLPLDGNDSERVLSTGRCWEWLAWFGGQVRRPDLIQVGYEQALCSYGDILRHERQRAARSYQSMVSENCLLVNDLEKRLRRWELTAK